ncbi:glycosyltransferase [Kluyvera cryocrescens]|uniref:glycosyltransferase n=1 Tax=Kluyvera cryocrescens TaxID=580 RepID=UPI002DBCB3E6|nr:glycosyltransferase [Kluyvera cryocrescens]MEB6633161.1 glycosyltransferase [Kluyvera cryocrescens]
MSNKAIHVLIIPSWYPQSPSDIGGSFFREQALALQKRGLKVGVISPVVRSLRDPIAYRTKFGMRYEHDNGLPTYRYNSINIAPRLPALAEYLWVMWGMKLFNEYIKEHGLPDVMHVHALDKAGFLAYKISQRYNIPYVVTEHSTVFARNIISLKKIRRLNKVVWSASGLFAVSKPFSIMLESIFGGSNWIYLPNIVSDIFFDSIKNNKKDSDLYTFINICMLTEKKKVDNLILAFKKLSDKYSNVHLKIGGDGGCRQSLELLVDQLALRDKVEFLGALSRIGVLENLQNSDAFVLSSEYETFGVVLIEALATGIPVISTKSGGPESIITSEVGVLVDKNSIQTLFDGMEYVYTNRHKFTSNIIKQYCKDNFSEDVIVNKLMEIYQGI